MSIALVVPTAREEQIEEFLKSWQDSLKNAKVTTYVVEDNPHKIFKINPEDFYNLQYLTWTDAPNGMLDCINTKSPCCRQIGFWKAYQDKHDVIITLDDDVRPFMGKNPFLEFSEILLNGSPLWIDPLHNYRSRGYPLVNVGNIKVSFHVGSFLAIPDVDGETQLKYENEFSNNPPIYVDRATIVPNEQLIPVNGGVCAFKREIAPYLHYTSWSKELDYRRFDDIWMGIILKRWMDLCNLRMSYGPPYVNHIRASDANKNLAFEKEARGWNEVFWQELDSQLFKMREHRIYSFDEAYEILILCLSKIDNQWAHMEAINMQSWRKLFK